MQVTDIGDSGRVKSTIMRSSGDLLVMLMELGSVGAEGRTVAGYSLVPHSTGSERLGDPEVVGQ